LLKEKEGFNVKNKKVLFIVFAAIISFICIFIGVVFILARPLSFYTFSPGSVFHLESIIRTEAIENSEGGNFLIVHTSIKRGNNVERIACHFRSYCEVFEVTNGESLLNEENRYQATQRMKNAQTNARIVALEYLEIDYELIIEFDLPIVNGVPISDHSGGIMFTLEIINQLSVVDLTSGHIIAGTGTIEIDGSVGTVGGIPQKVAAADRVGANVFFVPIANYEQAEEIANLLSTEMRIYGITSLNGALDILERLEPTN